MSASKEPHRVVLAIIVGLCSVSVVRADKVTFWNSLALDVVKENATHPPKAARDLAIVC